MRKAILGIALVALSGCGSLLNGSTKSFALGTEDKGVVVSGTPDIGEYQLPTTLKLQRDQNYVLRFSKDGYSDATLMIGKESQILTIFLDVIMTGFIGVVVDGITGDWNSLTPNKNDVFLDKTDSTITGPPRIRAYLLNPSPSSEPTKQAKAVSPVETKVEQKPEKPAAPKYPFVVYTSGTDKRFHLKGCRVAIGRLQGISRRQVEDKFTPCEVCFPPDSTTGATQ